MQPLALHEFHHELNGRFGELNGAETVNDYGDWSHEYAALKESAGVLDLSFRSRICLTGVDRVRFLHGQVTNDVKRLRGGEGGYAALVTAKGKMQSDLNIYALTDELLLDFEPGLTAAVTARLEKYIISDDVQIVDVAPHYGLLSVQGPKADDMIKALQLFADLPAKPLSFSKVSDTTLGELYLMNQPRLNSPGFDLFVPTQSLGAVADKLIAAAKESSGCACGWRAFEAARIEAGIPRFGADMDENSIPLECGIESRAVSYNKGCYIGQEVINRIHSIGHVNRELRRLRLPGDLKIFPARGGKLFYGNKEVGCVTSSVQLPNRENIAIGYVRREAHQPGNVLTIQSAEGTFAVTIVDPASR